MEEKSVANFQGNICSKLEKDELDHKALLENVDPKVQKVSASPQNTVSKELSSEAKQ